MSERGWLRQDMERSIAFIHVGIGQREWKDEYVGGWVFYVTTHEIHHVSVLKNPSIGVVTCQSSHRVLLDSNLSSKESSGTCCRWKTIHLLAHTDKQGDSPVLQSPWLPKLSLHSLPGGGASDLHRHFLYTCPSRFFLFGSGVLL